jgi:hypothetical protein
MLKHIFRIVCGENCYHVQLPVQIVVKVCQTSLQFFMLFICVIMIFHSKNSETRSWFLPVAPPSMKNMYKWLCPIIVRPFHDSGCYFMICHRGGLVSIPDQSVWDLWWKSCIGMGFSSNTSLSPCQYQSTNDPYPFIHVSPTVYNLSNWQRL